MKRITYHASHLFLNLLTYSLLQFIYPLDFFSLALILLISHLPFHLFEAHSSPALSFIAISTLLKWQLSASISRAFVRGYQESIQLSGAYATRQTS
jgi:hypothetical protein